jgi:hypothetical protein
MLLLSRHCCTTEQPPSCSWLPESPRGSNAGCSGRPRSPSENEGSAEPLPRADGHELPPSGSRPNSQNGGLPNQVVGLPRSNQSEVPNYPDCRVSTPGSVLVRLGQSLYPRCRSLRRYLRSARRVVRIRGVPERPRGHGCVDAGRLPLDQGVCHRDRGALRRPRCSPLVARCLRREILTSTHGGRCGSPPDSEGPVTHWVEARWVEAGRRPGGPAGRKAMGATSRLNPVSLMMERPVEPVEPVVPSVRVQMQRSPYQRNLPLWWSPSEALCSLAPMCAFRPLRADLRPTVSPLVEFARSDFLHDSR